MSKKSISWHQGQNDIKGASERMRLILLTASMIGIAFTWCIEMTYCTPYLLGLGLTKSRVSLVWIAGPLSGLIMQPVIGVLADRSSSRYGRRRPFMVGGAILTILSLILLGWTSECVRLLGISESNERSFTILLAVVSIYGVDFAINAVSSAARSLVVDSLPASKQQIGSAWASRNGSFGGLVGYIFGALNLQYILGDILGDTQFKRLIIVSIIVLTTCIGITCWAVDEEVYIRMKEDDQPESQGWMSMLQLIFKTTINLPRRISTICWIQFWVWIGWFPFLFYMTTFIGELYLTYDSQSDEEHADSLGQLGRVGSTSLTIYSLIAFSGTIFLPIIVESPDDRPSSFTPRAPTKLASLLTVITENRPSLATIWLFSHIIFACSMLMTPFITSYKVATVLVALCGLPSAVSGWAPFTFIGVEISKLGNSNNTMSGQHAAKARSSTELDREQGERFHYMEAEVDGDAENSGQLAGVYLGILNLFTTMPQFIGTFISWTVFSILEPNEGHNSQQKAAPNAIAVCLFIGALAAMVAALKTYRLQRSL